MTSAICPKCPLIPFNRGYKIVISENKIQKLPVTDFCKKKKKKKKKNPSKLSCRRIGCKLIGKGISVVGIPVVKTLKYFLLEVCSSPRD